MICFGKGYDSKVYATGFNGGTWANSSWGGYNNMGGTVLGNVSCTSQAADELLCGVYGADNNFYAGTWKSTSWPGWSEVATANVALGSPACAPLGTGHVSCAIRDASNKFVSYIGP